MLEMVNMGNDRTSFTMVGNVNFITHIIMIVKDFVGHHKIAHIISLIVWG